MPVEDITRIQQLACRGWSTEAIEKTTRIDRASIIRVLEPSEASQSRQPYRPERANVGYAANKARLFRR